MFFIPGLGADKRLFHLQRKAFPQSMALDWIAPLENESLARYARRWAKRLRLQPGCILVGVSFGGMIAQEMARQVKPKAVILVGSCRSPTSIPFLLRLAGSFPAWPRFSKRCCRTLPEVSGRILGGGNAGPKGLIDPNVPGNPRRLREMDGGRHPGLEGLWAGWDKGFPHSWEKRPFDTAQAGPAGQGYPERRTLD